MAIIKNKYKDKIDKKIKSFPNGQIDGDFTKKIIYDNETNINPTIIRSPKYGDDLDTTQFSKLVADLVYNDTIINEESEKHNYLYSDGVIKNFQKEFEIYDKSLLQVLYIYDVNRIIDKTTLSLKPGNSILGNFTDRNYCNFYFYTSSERLLSKYDFFYKEFSILDIKTMDNDTDLNFKDDYSYIEFKGEIPITSDDLLDNEEIGIVLYLPINKNNSTPYKSKNFINYIKIGNGAIKIGDTFVDIKKDTYISRSITDDNNLNQIKVPNIVSTNFKNSFRTRRDIVVAYYDQNFVVNNISFEGMVDLIIGDERINTYAPVDTQLLTTPRIKKIDYLTINNESFHRIYLDDLSLLKGFNSNNKEILFRKVNQVFTIRDSINNIFDGEYFIKDIDYDNRTIDFIHPSFNSLEYYQPQELENNIGYYGYLMPNVYILYSVLIYKDNGFNSETQIMKVDKVFDNVGVESGVNRIEKTILEINSDGMFEISKNDKKHLVNFNGGLLEYDDAQSTDVPSKKAADFSFDYKENKDFLYRPAEHQLPNEYQEIGFNSLSNSHFIITEDNFSVINNSKISLSEVILGVKNSLNSIGTEGIKIKINSIEMLYSLDDPRKIEGIEVLNSEELRISLGKPDSRIEVDDIIFIMNNENGKGDYQTVKIKKIENEKLIINKINSTSTAEFKVNYDFPIFFNIIKKNSINSLCESFLTNDEIKNQVLNGLNGKFGNKNVFSKLKFDRFIDNIDNNENLLKNGISLSQSKDFKIEINKYYFISVAGFTIDNISGNYSSILIEDHNLMDINHFKKGIYYEINIKSFKGRYPSSIIISDEFGDINSNSITRTFSPFFRSQKYSIMAYDFSNLDISMHDTPQLENVILFDPMSGRFKFHPNVTPSKIFLSFYTKERLSGGSEAENFIYKRGEDSNDTMRGKIQELDNKYVYGANFNSPISINGISINDNLNYKGPFRIKENKIELKSSFNFVDVDIDKYQIEIDKNSKHEIIDLEKNSIYLKENIVEQNNQIFDINRVFLDQLKDHDDKNYYEAPALNNQEEVIFNISEDTTIDSNLLNTKKWQYAGKIENSIAIPFLTNKKFNKISFYNFNDNLILDCSERTKNENLNINQVNMNEFLDDFVYRKLKERNYRYALKSDYNEDKTFLFKENDKILELNKTLIKDTKHFNKSEMIRTFIENEDNLLLKRSSFSYSDLNLNKTNSDNFIIIKDHIINIDIKKINIKYSNSIFFSDRALDFDEILPSNSSILEGTLFFYKTNGKGIHLNKHIEKGDFIIKNSINSYEESGWDFYKKNDFFNISKIDKNEDFSYSLNDFNDINVDFKINSFDNTIQKKLINSSLIKNDIVKINENKFIVFYLIKDFNDIFSFYLQEFNYDKDGFFYPRKIDDVFDYKKIATSQDDSSYLNINRNNLYYDILPLNDNVFVICMMSGDSCVFRYFYLDDLDKNDGLTFVNEKEIKSNPRIFKLNEEIFGILFNSENSLNYDSNVGDLEFKVYDIKTKNNIIFSYQEKNKNFEKVDKIVVDNIKNSSFFNLLKINDSKFIVFYSNINSIYLNKIFFSEDNNDYIPEPKNGLLNCFKIIDLLKTEDSYLFETSNKKMVYYQNIDQTLSPPKIYPFKINNNLFGVNYIQFNLNGNEKGNRMYIYNHDGVIQKDYFENDEYTSQNNDSIKYIYGLKDRYAIEFSNNDIKIHNFNNDYSKIILKEDFNYKTYFPNNDYLEIFKNKLNNGFEIKTISDKNGQIFNKKILTFFTKENNTFKINISLINDLKINFNEIESFTINFGQSSLLMNNNKISYQTDILYVGNKIFIVFVFLGVNSNINSLFIRLIEIGEKINGLSNNFAYNTNISNIKYIKITNDIITNKFFFNKKNENSIEIFSIRNKEIDSKNKNSISKHTLRILNENGDNEFLEIREDEDDNFNFNDKNIDFVENESDFNFTNIFKVFNNERFDYLVEIEKINNNIINYNYSYIQKNFQFLNLISLTVNKFNINYINYTSDTEELLFFGDINGNIVNYTFNFKNNLIDNQILDSNNLKYKFSKIEDNEKNCFLYSKIIDNKILIKLYLKKENSQLSLIHEESFSYSKNITDDIFLTNYGNIYDVIINSNDYFVRTFFHIFPMNNVKKSKTLLEYEILTNRVVTNQNYKKMFSGNSLSATINQIQTIDGLKFYISFFDESLINLLNEDSMEGLIFYINNNGTLCVFKVKEKMFDSDFYEITFLVGGSTKSNLYNKRLDYFLYLEDDFSFYKKSYQSSTIKVELFNYKGIKKNEYEIYRKNNYYYEKNKVFENNDLYKSNVYIVKGDYKDFQIVYNIEDEYEKTKIYIKKYLIINGNLYSFEIKRNILQNQYKEDDKIFFMCEKMDNSNIFFSFKKNNDFIKNFILNKNYGFEELDPDYTKRDLYEFVNIKNKILINDKLTEINILERKDIYNIDILGIKKLFNNYIILVLKIKKDSLSKIIHILYKEDGKTISYYNSNYNNLYTLPDDEDVIGYSKSSINSYGYMSFFRYKKDKSKDIVQFGIDGEGGVCKLKGIVNLF